MSIQEWQIYISIIKDIITAIVALIAGVVAIYGVIAWKKQLKGKTEYELARRVLRAIYKVRDSIRIVRSPIQTGGEIEEAVKASGISYDPDDKSTHAKTQAAIYESRWKQLNEARSNLQLELLEAEVSWGEGIKDKLKPLNECIGKLYATVYLYIAELERPSRRTDEVAEKNREESLRILYWVSDNPEEDSFSGKVKGAVEQIETFLKPHLKL
ncbi:MAG: hypothetical protein AUG51_14975 [Acidobacteria bacterium 13_1_20CM_3_53_8]|nr:MAG: hypothetical protein AUG51_14975 [Acidobacteria bacterium 13_1_20CM_3_53_8]